MKALTILRNISRIILLFFSILVFLFALVSGAEGFGGGIQGIITNSPNSLPWLLLMGIVYLTWRNEILGGSLITIMGVFTIFAFNTIKHSEVFFIISLPLIIFGIPILLHGYLERKNISR